ncbi:FGGY carbohydrate kinase domain-containing protein [Platysternon megacephalum]|uniref:FGGY carbohydrate kinase domain-containing protein n=1 Tax=Platysternon megacephalum TaxID=55544 RepID=A0A4D9EY66_9SAUR|nr:FGGY carbohydrate kinase domain-containing protein [Platysternon megacephalum]
MLSPRATLLAQGRSASVACLTALSKGTEYIPVGHAADCSTPASSYTPRQQNKTTEHSQGCWNTRDMLAGSCGWCSTEPSTQHAYEGELTLLLHEPPGAPFPCATQNRD